MSAPDRGPEGLGRARLLTAGFLLVVWMVVSGSYTTASLVGGLLVVAVLMLLFPSVGEGGLGHRVRPLMLVRYIGYYARELVLANVHVAQAVLTPGRVEHKRAIVEVPLPESSRLVTAILANGVMLTPGTTIIEVSEQPSIFHVHVLELDTPDTTRHAIAELHWRLVRAIGPADRLEEVERVAVELRRKVAEGAGPS